jgi:hypothetical protein
MGPPLVANASRGPSGVVPVNGEGRQRRTTRRRSLLLAPKPTYVEVLSFVRPLGFWLGACSVAKNFAK